MQKSERFKIPADYYIMFGICAVLLIMAFIFDRPIDILKGYIAINRSRSVLITDYVSLAGIGATLVNAAVSTIFFLILLIICKRNVNGKIIAALFLTVGFSLFGKNLLNSLPLCMGVLIYARVHKAKFGNYLSHAMFSATVAPVVSEIAFMNEDFNLIRFFLAYLAGLFIGFIFPLLTEVAKRMHRGYCLYNSGIAGGLISVFCAGILKSFGIEIIPEFLWDTEHTYQLTAVAAIVSMGMIIFGFVADKPKNAFEKMQRLTKETCHVNNDYLNEYRHACYINIGKMCLLSTAVTLFLGIPINGPILGAILTIAGFAAAGKHIRNTIPILIGSIMAANINHLDMASSSNALSILFSTALAPVAGKHGFIAGMVVGFFHVAVAVFIGNLYDGLNLYNNGFAAGFVAFTIVPLIVFFKETFGFRQRPEEPKNET